MDEIEARHKEVCTKCGVTPLVRPNFKEEGGESARQAIPKKEMAKSKSDGSILKKEQNSVTKNMQILYCFLKVFQKLHRNTLKNVIF